MAANAPETLVEAVLYFSDLKVCEKELAEARWPEGVTCPTCGRNDVSYLETQRRWQCKSKHAKRQFSAKVGTIFEDSPISLSKWFVAMWLIASAKNGISSYELQRSIGVKTQQTAWFMLHRIRLAMQAGSFDKLSGPVEADETYIGGAARFMHASRKKKLGYMGGRSRAGKVAVMGLLDRHGKDGVSQIRTQVLTDLTKRHVQGQVRQNVEAGSTLYTDAYESYEGLTSQYTHNVIDHAEKYVDGQIHTNGLENYWSLLKRAIKGTYVSVEPFHLFRYLDEQACRFNTRKLSDAARFNEVLRHVAGRRVTYAQLTGRPSGQPA